MRVTNAKLGDVIELLTDYHANGSYEKLKENVELLHDESYAVMIRTTNFSQNNFTDNLNYITEEAYHYLNKSKVFPNDIIMNKIADAGACYFMPDIDKPVSLGMNLFLIRIKDQLADPFFVFNYLRFHEHYVKSFASGSATKTITKDDTRKLKIYLPELKEQQKIAKILSTWDKAISTTERLIENSTQQKKALMQQLLTGKKRLLDESGNQFEGEWELKKVSDYFDVSSSKRVLQEDWKEDGVPFYRTRELVSLAKNEPFRSSIYIADDYYEELITKYGMPDEGDFLVSGVGTLGIIYQVRENDKFYFKDGNVLWFKKEKQVSSDFFKYCFLSDYIQNQINIQASVTTVGTYTITNAKKTKFHCPPLEEQQKIATVLTNADKEIELLEQQLADLQQEKKALMQVLLTGKKRVVVDG